MGDSRPSRLTLRAGRVGSSARAPYLAPRGPSLPCRVEALGRVLGPRALAGESVSVAMSAGRCSQRRSVELAVRKGGGCRRPPRSAQWWPAWCPVAASTESVLGRWFVRPSQFPTPRMRHPWPMDESTIDGEAEDTRPAWPEETVPILHVADAGAALRGGTGGSDSTRSGHIGSSLTSRPSCRSDEAIPAPGCASFCRSIAATLSRMVSCTCGCPTSLRSRPSSVSRSTTPGPGTRWAWSILMATGCVSAPRPAGESRATPIQRRVIKRVPASSGGTTAPPVGAADGARYVASWPSAGVAVGRARAGCRPCAGNS